MKTRMLLTMLLYLAAQTASASDTSPFYRNQFVVTERQACEKGTALAVDVWSFYKNQFVTTRAEACTAARRKEAAARNSGEAGQHRPGAAPASAQPMS
jgi:hypothetical protein